MKFVRGDLSLMSLPELMQWAELNMKTGTLVVTFKEMIKTFFIQDGKIIFVTSNTKGAQLGDFLQSSGYISSDQLTEAIKISQKFGIQLSSYLIAEKIVDKDNLEKAFSRYAERSFVDVLNWKEGEFEFSNLLQPNIINSSLKVNISWLMFQSVKNVEEAKIEVAPDIKGIMQEVARKLAVDDIEIPPIPDIVIKLNEYMQRDDVPVQNIVKTIMADQIITSKILKVANSSFYAPVKISSLHHAISYMGFKSILSIVTAYSLTSINSKNSKEVKLILRHSLVCAFISRKIASLLRLDPEELFLCGLLHDIGKTVLSNLFLQYKLPEDVKKYLIDKYHPGAGYAVANKWKLSDTVKATIRYHHEPEKALNSKEFVESVFIANGLANDPEGFFKGLTYRFKVITIETVKFDDILKDMQHIRESVDSII